MKLGNKTTGEFDAYTPESKEVYSISDLFAETGAGYYINQIRSKVSFSNRGAPCDELIDHVNKTAINTKSDWLSSDEGQACYPDNVYFEIVSREDGNVLFQKYQTIIGSRAICYVA